MNTVKLLPKEKLTTFFRQNRLVGKEHKNCDWCYKVSTRGRDRLDGAICEQCILDIQMRRYKAPPPERKQELIVRTA